MRPALLLASLLGAAFGDKLCVYSTTGSDDANAAEQLATAAVPPEMDCANGACVPGDLDTSSSDLELSVDKWGVQLVGIRFPKVNLFKEDAQSVHDVFLALDHRTPTPCA